MLSKYLLIFILLSLSLSSCGEKESKLAPVWSGTSEKFIAQKKTKAFKYDPQIKVDDEMLREMAENLFIMQENASEELKVSEGLTFGTSFLYYLGNMGSYTLNASQINKLLKGFEKLMEKPIDKKSMPVLDQVKSIKFTKMQGKCRVQVQGKDTTGIVYFINERNYDEDSSLKEIKFVQVKNGASVEITEVRSFSQREELNNFVKDTGKRDSIHKDIPKHIEDYFHMESPSPILKMKFSGIMVRVDTRTIWKNIDFDFKYGWAIPLFRIDDKKIPGFVMFLKKKLAKVKNSIDQ